MGEGTSEIAEHIAEQRYELGQNLNELQHKVQNALDWKRRVARRPFYALGLAFAGGSLLAAITRRQSHSRYNR
jgi:hypothetical protein